MHDLIANVHEYLVQLQKNIFTELEVLDGEKKFQLDEWTHNEGGGGITAVLSEGAVFEKAGVNFSHIAGLALPKAASDRRPDLAGRKFEATGVSLVLHPNNPYVPTTHFNIRCIVAFHESHAPIFWFGGGFDLTPYYGFDEDCIHFHQVAKDACDSFGKQLYPEFKIACDNYFYLPHRNEPRGIGGIFFDDLVLSDFANTFSFLKSIGDSFLKAYTPIVERRKNMKYTERERKFQLIRRGRYVEFNLIYDRGTIFGLQSRGRTESILMSLPPVVNFDYQPPIEIGSEEEKLMQYYLKPKAWIPF